MSLQNGENFMQVIILQTETFFFLFRLRPAASTSILVTHYLFSSLKNPEKELRKIRAVETAKENKQPKNHSEKSLHTLFPHATRYFWLAKVSRSALIKVHFLYIMHKRLQCYKTKDTSLTWKFCFPNAYHVLLSREFSFGHFQTHVYICTCREWGYYSLENHHMVCIRKTKFKSERSLTRTISYVST